MNTDQDQVKTHKIKDKITFENIKASNVNIGKTITRIEVTIRIAGHQTAYLQEKVRLNGCFRHFEHHFLFEIKAQILCCI